MKVNSILNSNSILKTAFLFGSILIAMSSCNNQGKQATETTDSTQSAQAISLSAGFDTVLNGKEVKLYTLKNKNNMEKWRRIEETWRKE